MGRNQGTVARQVRTLFISDVHLGCRHAQSDALLAFLDRVTPQRLFIVGDFIDGWQLQRSFRWQPHDSRLLERLDRMVADGIRIFYVPGNHDDFLRQQSFVQTITKRLGVSLLEDEFIFETADHRRFLVTHGDQFDVVERSAQWVSKALTLPYDALLSLNWVLSRLLSRQDESPYRLCAAGKGRVKRLIRFLSAFENSLLSHARDRGCHGVICGHVHTPAILERDGMTYCNTGDWVENCSALLETDDGTLELAHYYPRSPGDAVVRSPGKAAAIVAETATHRPPRRATQHPLPHPSPIAARMQT